MLGSYNITRTASHLIQCVSYLLVVPPEKLATRHGLPIYFGCKPDEGKIC